MAQCTCEPLRVRTPDEPLSPCGHMPNCRMCSCRQTRQGEPGRFDTGELDAAAPNPDDMITPRSTPRVKREG